MSEGDVTEGQRGGRRSRGGAGGGREARRAARETKTIRQLPYINRGISPFSIMNEDALVLIEENADTILQEIGVEFREDPEAIQMWKDAGADVDGERVRMPKGMARELCKTAPKSFVQHARNPERNVLIGDTATVFAPVYGPPFVRDYEGGRRYATIEDFRNFVKLAYMSPGLHHSGGTVCEPVDLPVNKRHYDMLYTHMRYSDKPFMGSVTHPDRAQESVDMAKILFGEEFVQNNTVMVSLINANSPLTWDATMLGALKIYARNNQAVITAPFILSGAMSPVTVAGTMAQTLAEGMAGIAFSQLCRKGAPAILGSFASSISMQSGAPTFGTPEPAQVLYGMAELTRRLGVPFRSGGSLCGSKIPDAQAAYESANTLLPTVLGGVNFVLHAAGWLEGGLASSYEKLVMDADQLAMMHTMMGGVDVSENGQAMDALREVGPGGHFLGCDHTQRNFETAFFRSEIANNATFEQWQAEGSIDTFQAASNLVKKKLGDYQAPPIDPGTDEQLLDFIARSKASFPDSNI